jgi:hypothetical protein
MIILQYLAVGYIVVFYAAILITFLVVFFKFVQAILKL